VQRLIYGKCAKPYPHVGTACETGLSSSKCDSCSGSIDSQCPCTLAATPYRVLTKRSRFGRVWINERDSRRLSAKRFDASNEELPMSIGATLCR
jgi:hypothetical protein